MFIIRHSVFIFVTLVYDVNNIVITSLGDGFCRWISCFSQCYFQYVEALSHILQLMLHQLKLFGRLRKFSSRSRWDFLGNDHDNVLYSIAYTRLTIGDLDVLVAKILYHIYSTATQKLLLLVLFPEPQFRVESALVNDLDGIDHWANWFLQLETQYRTACSIPQWFPRVHPFREPRFCGFPSLVTVLQCQLALTVSSPTFE